MEHLSTSKHNWHAMKHPTVLSVVFDLPFTRIGVLSILRAARSVETPLCASKSVVSTPSPRCVKNCVKHSERHEELPRPKVSSTLPQSRDVHFRSPDYPAPFHTCWPVSGQLGNFCPLFNPLFDELPTITGQPISGGKQVGKVSHMLHAHGPWSATGELSKSFSYRSVWASFNRLLHFAKWCTSINLPVM